MEPITIMVSALAAGAMAALKLTAEQAVKDAYAAVKRFIQDKYTSVALDTLEKKPESEAKRASVAEDLTDAGAAQDRELATLVQSLAQVLEQHDPGAAAAIGVDLERVKAAALRIKEVAASGTGIRVRESEFTGDIDIGTVRAGSSGGTPDPKV